jgi:hypothetical protein
MRSARRSASLGAAVPAAKVAASRRLYVGAEAPTFPVRLGAGCARHSTRRGGVGADAPAFRGCRCASAAQARLPALRAMRSAHRSASLGAGVPPAKVAASRRLYVGAEAPTVPVRFGAGCVRHSTRRGGAGADAPVFRGCRCASSAQARLPAPRAMRSARRSASLGAAVPAAKVAASRQRLPFFARSGPLRGPVRAL